VNANKRLALDIGLRIAKRRLELGLSQSQLGGRMEVGRDVVSHAENGRSVPSVPTLLRFAKALELTSLDVLVTVQDG
jgi:transcriptional regulator with XRE-family HTH domain